MCDRKSTLPLPVCLPSALVLTYCMSLLGNGSVACSSEPRNAVSGPTEDARPNIVLIIADDQAYGDFGFMGNDTVRTPRLDELARQSARYPNGYVPMSVCRPSLATVLTGLYPHEHSIHFNHPPPGYRRMKDMKVDEWKSLRRTAEHLIRDVPTLPRILADHGYACLQTGKHWEGDYVNAGFTHGMTRNQPSSEPAYGNRRLADGVVAHGNGDAGLAIGRDTMQPIFDFVQQHRQDPFLIWYAPFLPHVPFDAPERFRQGFEDRNDIPEYLIGYYAEIARFDATVGQLVDAIEDEGLAEKTLFLFVVDNGFRPDTKPNADGAYENIAPGTKLSTGENGLRTPILIRWDGHTRPATHNELVQSVDIVPTVVAAAGISVEKGQFSGVNLLPSATGKERAPNRPAFGEIYPNDASSLGNPAGDIAYRWIRDDVWKLIVPDEHFERAWFSAGDQIALFNLADDPAEQNNLATQPEHVSRVQTLRQRLDAWWTPGAEAGEL